MERKRFGRQRYIKHLISSRNSRRTFERKSYGTYTEAQVEKEKCSTIKKLRITAFCVVSKDGIFILKSMLPPILNFQYRNS
ncbi:unnamed protein product [Caenorhabditis angaria]|uniref:Uncharacterized protein n=1 Tax=Caenorhabditis angaria TaxID=860376 RepID=A0A9P1ICB2_9PELO|nr:unnamed protein product [Caenorhabditis angaria]